MSVRVVFAYPVFALLAVSGLLVDVASCDDAPPTGTGAPTGAGGSVDAGCPQGLQPMFTVTITASDGPVPPDTSLAVTWSAGPEPVFALNDISTWKTLEQGTNVICDVDPSKPPPGDLPELVCRLWTSGATEVVLKAKGHQTYTETLISEMSEQCEGPLPKTVPIKLLPETDAGTFP